MLRWDATGARTERIVVDGRTHDAPLVVMKSGEILPLILRFPKLSARDGPEVLGPVEHHEAAESLIGTLDMVLGAGGVFEKARVGDGGKEIRRAALALLADAVQLYRSSGRDAEVERVCAMVTRQMRLGLLALQVRRAVFRALRAGDAKVAYRRFTRVPKDVGSEKRSQGDFVTTFSKEYRGRKVTRPSGGHVYEIVQGAARVTMPVLQGDGEAEMAASKEGTDVAELLPVSEPCDALKELCSGIFPEEQPSFSDAAYGGGYAYYGDEPHLCCALPSVATSEAICCETELHDSFITRWEPWGMEENSAVAVIALLLRDGKEMCERMMCYGLDRRTHAEMEG